MARHSSRLERQERQKILKQTGIFIGIAITIGVAFIFLIIPGFIRVLNTFFGVSTEGFEVTDTIPPQVPIVSAPVEATSDPNVELRGFAEPESTVVVLLNGQESTVVTANDSGEFSLTVLLSEGDNSIALYSADAAGNESAVTAPYQVKVDREPPILEVTSPASGARIDGVRNQTLSVTGTTDPDARVFLNERVVFPNTEGAFSSSYFLSEGENKLTITAVDAAGNETLQEVTVTFVR